MKCYVLIDLITQTAHACTDMEFIAEVLRIDASTVKRRLPYWTDGKYIITAAEYVKSNRGGPGNKNFCK
jgi:hypothetical protein